MWKIVLTVLAGTALGSSALAADMVIQAPVETGHDWSGLYAGVHLGHAWNDYEIDVGFVAPYSFDADGLLGGAQAGFNWQSGLWVLGLEADVTYVDHDGNDGGFLGAVDALNTRWAGTVRGRVGVAAGGSLVYATGGLGWMNYDYWSAIVPAGPAVVFSDTDAGWTVGGGFEYAFDQNWSAKAEYLYADFGDRDRSAAIFAAPWETSLTSHQIRFGLNYKFGG